MDHLSFFLNGERVVLKHADPTTRLVDYLRSTPVGLTGTKKSCGEGGCGACTVMLSCYDGRTDAVVHKAVNSCRTPLGYIDGRMVTTIEGIGSTRERLSPVQHRLASGHGTQCGYCTPGFVMNMRSFLQTGTKEKITGRDVERIFNGNLCRCTGYRSILQAMKTFAVEGAPENKEHKPSSAITRDAQVPVSELPDELKRLNDEFPRELKKKPEALHVEFEGRHWYRPTNMKELFTLLKRLENSGSWRLVLGNTCPDVRADNLVDISRIDELKEIEIKGARLEIGAGATYDRLIRWLDRNGAPVQGEQSAALEAVGRMARRTAGTMVKNLASLGGNIARAGRDIDFASDILTVFGALGAYLKIWTASSSSSFDIPVLKFVKHYSEYSRAVIIHIRVH